MGTEVLRPHGMAGAHIFAWVAGRADSALRYTLSMAITRRELAMLGAWAQAQAAQHHAAPDQPPKFRVLDAAFAREIEAIAAEIIPSGASPGAREAGVIYFVDRALETFDRHQLPVYRSGLAEMQATRRKLFPSSRDIASLPHADLLQLIKAVETTDFLEAVRVHTIMGFLADPSYGGNRNQVGWKHIGLESAHRFEPPFGFYDAKRSAE